MKKWRNDGKDFEREFERVAGEYHFRQKLTLEKCDPPTRIVRGQIIYQANPFLDWVGAWTERAGRALFIETKSTTDPSLPMSESGKLTRKQKDMLIRWHHSGAAVGVVWQVLNPAAVFFIPVGQIKTAWDAGRRSIRADECQPIKQGMGFVTFDFIENLRHWYPL